MTSLQCYLVTIREYFIHSLEQCFHHVPVGFILQKSVEKCGGCLYSIDTCYTWTREACFSLVNWSVEIRSHTHTHTHTHITCFWAPQRLFNYFKIFIKVKFCQQRSAGCHGTIHKVRVLEAEPSWESSWVRAAKWDPPVFVSEFILSSEDSLESLCKWLL